MKNWRMLLATHGSRITVLICALLASACVPITEPVPVEDRSEPVVEKPLPPPPPPPLPPSHPAAKVDPPPPRIDRGPEIGVVISSANPAYRRIAVALGSRLGAHTLYDLSIPGRSPADVMTAIAAAKTDMIVAIGLPAAQAAKSHSEVPTVFCQVFNYESSELLSSRMSGVSSTPPLEDLIREWKKRSPGLRNIGAILGGGHSRLIEEAESAAAANGVTLHHRTAGSDRETLYLFNQLLPSIDGFWLFPDNRILSVSVLREMLEYASRHSIEVAVFNDSLLSHGATLSISSVDADVAETVVSVIDRVIANGGRAIPGIVPLSKIEVKP